MQINLSIKTTFTWLITLAFLAVGAKNFELGLSADGPIYSTIARNMVRSGDWFTLNSNVPDFHQLHPHLGFWFMSLSFKLFGYADYSARLPGHLFYLLFLFILFRYIRNTENEMVATLTILVLFSFSYFSNPFSNVYLDPSFIFFGFLSLFFLDNALRKKNISYSFWGGLCLSAAALIKGLTVLGFLPIIAFLFIAHFDKKDKIKNIKLFLIYLFSILPLLLVYYFLVQASTNPNFFHLYWQSQYQERYRNLSSLSNFFLPRYWQVLLRNSYYLAPISLLAYLKAKRLYDFFPLVISFSFICLYAPNLCIGSHYLLPILPGIAWGFSRLIAPRIKLNTSTLVKASQYVSIIAVLILQYIPFRTHGMHPNLGEEVIADIKRKRQIETLLIDGTPYYTDFINSSRYAWWGDINVKYVVTGSPLPNADSKSLLLLFWKEAKTIRKEELNKKGWCVLRDYPERSILSSCPSNSEENFYSVFSPK